jgi:hypothetical protein
MKLTIIILIETLLLIFFLLLAIIRTGEAEKASLHAELLAQEAVSLQKSAQNEAERAERMAAEAVKAQAALEVCMTGK